MAVKVLISRQIKEGALVDVLMALSQLRSKALQQPGYISGETLVGEDDPHLLVVISTWDDAASWRKWKEDPARWSAEQRIEPFLSQPPRYEVFRMRPYGG